MDGNIIKIGDEIEVEQAWEDEGGNYHDESAKVISIDNKGEMRLEFQGVDEKVQNFLKDCSFNVKDYQHCVIK